MFYIKNYKSNKINKTVQFAFAQILIETNFILYRKLCIIVDIVMESKYLLQLFHPYICFIFIMCLFPLMYLNIICISVPNGVCNNRHFQKPTRSEFQAHMKEVLRTAKERLRHKRRGPRTQSTANRRRIHRDLWNDEQQEEAEKTDEMVE